MCFFLLITFTVSDEMAGDEDDGDDDDEEDEDESEDEDNGDLSLAEVNKVINVDICLKY